MPPSFWVGSGEFPSYLHEQKRNTTAEAATSTVDDDPMHSLSSEAPKWTQLSHSSFTTYKHHNTVVGRVLVPPQPNATIQERKSGDPPPHKAAYTSITLLSQVQIALRAFKYPKKIQSMTNIFSFSADTNE